ncbi:MAG: coenzyme-B sulfoethylthiotransferase subunit gamma [Candidatus Helarchaeota archaeon]|nr:coenzyme-B sulfoethylthiotransferase subunit gamma [Candidatus Helarchaeota archaeon]
MPMSERRGKKQIKSWEPQFYPGYGRASERRRKVVNRDRRLVKLRNIPDDDIVRLLGHRAPGGLYLSLHPPLDELMEAYDPIKELVIPSPGADSGDRMRFVQMVDSFWRPPIAPWLRERMYFTRFRGIDTVVEAERTLLEMRERDVEAAAKLLIEMEVFDTGRTALRSITPQGHSTRLDEMDLMFDARKRYILDFDTGHIVYTKNMHAETLDKPVPLGYPVTDNELKAIDPTYRWDTGQYKSKSEVLIVLSRIGELRILGGFKPDMINGL